MKLDLSNINDKVLMEYLLGIEYNGANLWRKDVEIVLEGAGKFIDYGYRVYYTKKAHTGETYKLGLRWSKGPLQGFGWDTYGDRFHNKELAILALSQAPVPLGVINAPSEWNLVTTKK